MRKTLAIAAAAVLIPSAALAEEKEKPGVVDSLGAAVGGALGYTAGAAGGPLGSAVGGLAGQSIGKGLVGGVKKLFGMDKKPKTAETPAPTNVAELSPPADGAPATLDDLEASGGAPAAAEAGQPAAAEVEAAPEAQPELIPAPAPATLDGGPPQAVPAT
ncbi:hypothetical protein [Phenylobacterium sp.]|jgi:hypothetical protein|uniref:hypothetical protein n=1 Tax=Phenylobacterium sp. TaxID=1871053 RepID=UPI002E33351A|nr:hypothetical protein [Phenylobacterium sp.]HEX2561774.1 hypothetical protein [Phenylobacterium sp.]